MKCYVELFFLSTVIVAATCFHFHADDDGAAWESTVADDGIKYDDAKKDGLTSDKFAYKVSKAPNVFCTLANMTITIKSPQIKDGLTVPKTAVANGTCGNLVSDLKLSWDENEITFTFINDYTSFSILSMNLSIAAEKDKPKLRVLSGNVLRLFPTSIKNGIHSCTKATTSKIGELEITISEVSLIAFNTEADISKRSEEECSSTEDIVKTFPYKLVNEAGDVCSLAKWSMVFTIPYKTKDSKTLNAVVKVPVESNEMNVTGTCGTALSQMRITWPATKSLTNSITFVFEKDDASTFISTIVAKIYTEEKKFPNAAELNKLVTVNVLSDDKMFLASAKNGVYSCKNGTELDVENVAVNITDVILVAFNAKEDFSSKAVAECQHVLSLDDFNYKLKESETSVPCILAKMSITMDVPHQTQDSNDNNRLTVPSEVDVSGFCDPYWPILTLTWPTAPAKKFNNSIMFEIANDKMKFYIYRMRTTVYLSEENDKNTLTGITEEQMHLFPADMSTGVYQCKDAHEIKVSEIKMTITDVLFIAHNQDTDLSKKKASGCTSPVQTTTLATTVSETDKTTKSVTSETTKSETSETAKSESQPTTHPTDSPSKTTIPPSPPVDPSIEKYDYVLTNPETHIACVLANMTIQLTINYKTVDSKSEKKIVPVPKTAEVQGTCENTTATMNLIWTPEEVKYESVKNTVSFLFQKDASAFYVKSLTVDFNLDEKNFPNATDKKCNGTIEKLRIFSASMKDMYKCDPGTVLDANDIQVKIEDVALIAFNSDKNVTSRAEENCEKPAETDANVGAIVGGVIGGVLLLAIFVYVYISWKRGRIYRS